jgi:multidrug/hemolysin transport system permease protein
MSLITLVLAEIYIVFEGGAFLTPAALLKVLAYLLVADIANTSMIFFMTSFFSSNNAFSAASTVIGTLIGFITGIYLPIGSLPEAVQWVVKVFPTSHAAVLLRQVMMADPISKGFSGVPEGQVSWIPEFLGVTFKFGENELSAAVSIAILLGSALLFFSGAVIVLSRKKKS